MEQGHPRRSNIKNFGSLPTSGFIRQSQLIPHIIPFSPATLWRKVKTGEFPKPVKLSERITAWDVNSVRDWLELKRAGKIIHD